MLTTKRLLCAVCLAALWLPSALADTKVSLCDGVEELALPAVPASLTAPSDRADYVLLHFWDNMDFRDTVHARDQKFMEQSMVNFLSVMPHGSDKAKDESVKRLYDSAGVDSESLQMVDELAEMYLYGYDSPMYDEELFLRFVEARLASPHFDADSKERDRMLKEAILKNRMGTVAADFEFVKSDGTTGSLRQSIGDADKTILLFYDPECEDCHEAIARIKADGALSGLNVVAVYDGGEADLWRSHLGEMPQGWTVGMTTESVEEGDAYTLPATPTIFLLGRDGVVLQKNTTVEKIAASLR